MRSKFLDDTLTVNINDTLQTTLGIIFDTRLNYTSCCVFSMLSVSFLNVMPSVARPAVVVLIVAAPFRWVQAIYFYSIRTIAI